VGQALTRVWRSADPGALDHEGMPASAGTIGIQHPVPTIATGVRRIGKDSRRLGAGRGVLTRPEHIEYGSDDFWPDTVRALSLLAPSGYLKRKLASDAGLSARTADRAFAGMGLALETKRRLLKAVAARTRMWLRFHRPDAVVPEDDRAAIAAYPIWNLLPFEHAPTADGRLWVASSAGAQIDAGRWPGAGDS
jgi:hypothetical protein